MIVHVVSSSLRIVQCMSRVPGRPYLRFKVVTPLGNGKSRWPLDVANLSFDRWIHIDLAFLQNDAVLDTRLIGDSQLEENTDYYCKRVA